MRTLLLLGTGFWLFVAVSVSPVAYAMVAACLMLLCADFCLRVSTKRVKRLDRRLERWCNPMPLPETRGSAIKPRLVHAEVRPSGPAGRAAGTGERNSVKEIKPVRTEVRRSSRTAESAKHPGQDSNLQPAD